MLAVRCALLTALLAAPAAAAAPGRCSALGKACAHLECRASWRMGETAVVTAGGGGGGGTAGGRKGGVMAALFRGWFRSPRARGAGSQGPSCSVAGGGSCAPAAPRAFGAARSG